jgi:hypothetical protein
MTFPGQGQGRGERVDTLTKGELEKLRGGLVGNGAADMVVDRNGHLGEAKPHLCRGCGKAIEGRPRAAWCSELCRRKHTYRAPAETTARSAPEPPPPKAREPVATWDAVLQRLASAGIEVRGVVLADGFLLSRA